MLKNKAENIGVLIATFEKEDNKEKKSMHTMYHAMELFFLNGGGPCYIISTGPYVAIGVPPG